MVTVTKQSANGFDLTTAPQGGKSTLTPPRIERWLDVPDYPGYRVRLWINHPRHLRSAFEPPAEGIEDLEGDALQEYIAERKVLIEGALAAIVIEHNGWPDEDGNVLPQATDPTIWDRMDQHLANIVMRLAVQAPSQLPNSGPTHKRR